MSGIQNFRSALNGFNRQDVVSYIEYINHKHNLQVEQLNSQLQAALARSGDGELQAQLEAAQARIRELEAAQNGETPVNCTEQELEAYRRAERAERQAKERAQQIYAQANAVLADAAVKAEELSAQVGAAANQVAEQLKAYQQTILDTKTAYQETAAGLYAIRPEEE